MAKFVLPGGTDVAEVALFSLDALRDEGPDGEELVRLEGMAAIVRFPTGGDGGYLLHAYVDESIPGSIARYCDKSDRKTARISLPSGRVGFGGVESAFASYKPNSNIRTDGSFPPGDYDVEAFHTEFPDGLVEKEILERVGKRGMRLLSLPAYLIPMVLLLAVGALALKAWLIGVIVVGTAVVGLKGFYFRSPTIKKLREQQLDAQREYPSIVVALRSKGGVP